MYDEWAAFCCRIGLTELPHSEEYKDWRSTIYIGDRKDTHGGVYKEFFSQSSSREASKLITQMGGISVKFQDYAELLAHPQIKHLKPLRLQMHFFSKGYVSKKIGFRI